MVWATEEFDLSFSQLTRAPSKKTEVSCVVSSKGPNLKEMTG